LSKNTILNRINIIIVCLRIGEQIPPANLPLSCLRMVDLIALGGVNILSGILEHRVKTWYVNGWQIPPDCRLGRAALQEKQLKSPLICCVL